MFPVADVIPSRTTPWMTVALIAANVLAFLYALSLPPADGYAWTQRFAFVPVEASWTTATTSLFLHENSVHLALNIIVLWVFGDNVEDQLGHGRFLALYLLSGYAAWAASLWATPASNVPLAGANGAIAGLMGAYFVMFPRSRVLVLVPARSVLDAIELPQYSSRLDGSRFRRSADSAGSTYPCADWPSRSGRTWVAPWRECSRFGSPDDGNGSVSSGGELRPASPEV